MRKISLLSLTMLLTLLFFASCETEDDTGRSGDHLLATFCEDATETRATGGTWEDGDLIGIFCVKPGQSLGASNFADNKSYRYNASAKKFEPATKADEIYFGRHESFSFYAYYPYRSDIGNPTAIQHNVGTSQQALANHRRADLITGRSTKVSTDGTVMMSFYHAMTMIQLDWSARNTPTPVTSIAAKFRNTATVNLASPVGSQVTTTGSTSEIMMYRNSGDNNAGQYFAFVPTTTITPEQDIFIPYNSSGNKVSEALRYKGSSSTTLLPGNKYNLTGTLFEITASVADGTFESGYAGGMFFRDRECILKVNRSDNTNSACKFVGFYEENSAGKLTLITGSGITSTTTHAEYRFTVSSNRRIKAVFTHTYSDWVANEVTPTPGGSTPGNITVENQTGGSVSPDGVMKANGKNITIRPEGGQFNLTASAIREVRLNGVVINHEYASNLTIRNNSSVSGFTWTPPTFKATVNTDINGDGSIKGERHTTLTIVGPDGKDITVANGGVVNVKQLAASWVNNWSIKYTLSGNPIATTGGSATVNFYAVNNRTLAGVSSSSYIVYAQPASSSDNSAFTKSATSASGANNWMFTVSIGENRSAERGTNIVLSHEGATASFRITQNAGVKVYGKPVITFTTNNGTSARPLSSAANEMAVLSYSVSATYQWNGAGAVYTETYYPTISGSATGFNRTETASGTSLVKTEANYGTERSVTYTATFSIGGQTANPVSVTIYQKRAWNVDT